MQALESDLGCLNGDLIQDVSRLRRLYFDQRCRPLGITQNQWWMMYNLSCFEHGEHSQADLAKRLGIGPAAASEVLIRTERAGFIRREDNPDNRRAKRLVITERGRHVLDAVYQIVVEDHEDIVAGLAQHETAELYRCLDQVKRNLIRLLGAQ